VIGAPILQACLNGARAVGEHPALPLSADELALDAARCWTAGAHGVHVHPRDEAGEQTLAPGACAVAIAAIRAAAPQVEVSLSTGAWIEPDVERRIALVQAWTLLPDCASVNLSEAGAVELCRALSHRGVEVEAGLASLEDAELYLSSGVGRWARRVLVEVPDRDPAEAVAQASRIDAIVGADLLLPVLWHGEGRATWAVIVAGARAGRAIRIGLEDTLELPDGSAAPGNEAIVRAASELQRRAVRARR
jgi:uncharacterized protein (DUF849 family)